MGFPGTSALFASGYELLGWFLPLVGAGLAVMLAEYILPMAVDWVRSQGVFGAAVDGSRLLLSAGAWARKKLGPLAMAHTRENMGIAERVGGVAPKNTDALHGRASSARGDNGGNYSI